MPESVDPEVSEPTQDGREAVGCGRIVLFSLSVVWIALGTVLLQLPNWVMEQLVFEGSFGLPNVRVFIAAGYGISLLLPFGLLTILVKDSKLNNYFRLWLVPSIFVLMISPARIFKITAFHTASLIQIGGMILFLASAGIWWRSRQMKNAAEVKLKGGGRGVGLAVLTGGMLIFPWLIWGALGSVMDLLISFTVSLLFGLCFSLIFSLSIYPEIHNKAGSYRVRNHLVDGLAVSLALVIMTAGLSQSGNQGLLMLSVPILGWVVVALSRFGKEREPGVNWQAVGLAPAIAILWGLIWFDPDELMFVIGSGQGEIMGLANRAMLLSLGIGVVISIAALFLRKYLEKVVELTLVWIVVISALFGSVGCVYFLAGQPGLYGDRMFVILKDQMDVSSFSQIEDSDQRRVEVYQSLVAHAGGTQSDLRSVLDRMNINYRAYYLVNGIEVRAGPLVRLWLLTRPEVDRVLDSPILRPLPSPVPVSTGSGQAPKSVGWNLSMIQADRVWDELGVRGQGVVIGQSDSGAQFDHPELMDSYRGQDGEHNYNWYDPWNQSQEPVDIGGHGTHTLGSVLGNSVGVAPDANWIGCSNLARNLGNVPLYLECMQFMLAPFPLDGDPLLDGEPMLGAQILNNSWGCPEVEGCDPDALLPAVKALRSAGIFVVVGAGNSGYSGCGSVNAPMAIYDEVYTVGAVNLSGQLASFSSIGPVTVDDSDRNKPDIVAPGENVLSSFPNMSYEIASGTSMAGPHLVGVVALMWSANPDLIGEIDATEQILDQTAQPFRGTIPLCLPDHGVPNNAAGFGVVDAYEAVKMAMAYEN